MKANITNEFGPIYDNHFIGSELYEPRFIEVDNRNNISLLVDKNHNEEYGYQCFGKPIILNETSKAYSYDVISYVNWDKNLKFKINSIKYENPFITVVEPASIQILEDGCYLLALSKRQIVVIINNKGEIIWQFGKDNQPGTGNKLCVPMFAVKWKDKILISDTLNSRVILVDKNGNIIWEYGIACELGSLHNHLWYPMCAIGKDKYVFICDSKNNRILKLNFQKEILMEIGKPLVKEHQLCYPRSIQVLSNGNWLIANTHKSNIVLVEPFTNRIIKTISRLNSVDFLWPRCAKLDEKNNRLYIADGLNNRIVVLDYNTLKLVRLIISDENYTLCDPHDIDIAPNGNVLITSADSNQIIEFDSNYNFIRKWNNNLIDPHSAKYIEDGIIITNTGNAEIIIINNKVEIIKEFYNQTEKCIQTLNRPRFALYAEKYIYVLDTGNHRLLKIHQIDNKWFGKEITIEGNNLVTLNNFNYPRWLCLSKDNQLLVTDTENNRVLQCDI